MNFPNSIIQFHQHQRYQKYLKKIGNFQIWLKSMNSSQFKWNSNKTKIKIWMMQTYNFGKKELGKQRKIIITFDCGGWGWLLEEAEWWFWAKERLWTFGLAGECLKSCSCFTAPATFCKCCECCAFIAFCAFCAFWMLCKIWKLFGWEA